MKPAVTRQSSGIAQCTLRISAAPRPVQQVTAERFLLRASLAFGSKWKATAAQPPANLPAGKHGVQEGLVQHKIEAIRPVLLLH